ncbi:hypothetical protein [Geomesophilobacter sediminis]|nr:hypothetical protein [Geomesophilobacter sediminis]
MSILVGMTVLVWSAVVLVALVQRKKNEHEAGVGRTRDREK